MGSYTLYPLHIYQLLCISLTNGVLLQLVPAQSAAPDKEIQKMRLFRRKVDPAFKEDTTVNKPTPLQLVFVERFVDLASKLIFDVKNIKWT